MLLTILSDQRVIGGAQIDEPVPFAAPQENGHCLKSSSKHSRSSVSDQIRLRNDLNISKLREDRIARYEVEETGMVFRWCLEVEMEKIVIGGVVEGRESACQATDIAFRSRDKVGKGDWIPS